jgi:hypothetical protein
MKTIIKRSPCMDCREGGRAPKQEFKATYRAHYPVRG